MATTPVSSTDQGGEGKMAEMGRDLTTKAEMASGGSQGRRRRVSMTGQSSYSRLAGDDAAVISAGGGDDYDAKKLRLLGYEPQLKRNLSYVLH
ncbi:unnamed protein product [Triticum turgidum subsp. durum]|uniref:Uncharacterized protein n=2 Tax=Triticum TaxID=4564 RepID=A0A9R1QH69_TRITD|nr:unnamed protein product [Triticum aestivum]VAH77383.1 unnamed protein product [Triticum turgidum subsp. durum]